MTMQQNVPIPEVPRVAVMRIEGNVVRHEEPRIEQLVAEFLENGVRAFVFDFDRVTFIDSAGIGLIIKLAAIPRIDCANQTTRGLRPHRATSNG